LSLYNHIQVNIRLPCSIDLAIHKPTNTEFKSGTLNKNRYIIDEFLSTIDIILRLRLLRTIFIGFSRLP
jgi:hypothetical protein